MFFLRMEMFDIYLSIVYYILTESFFQKMRSVCFTPNLMACTLTCYQIYAFEILYPIWQGNFLLSTSSFFVLPSKPGLLQRNI